MDNQSVVYQEKPVIHDTLVIGLQAGAAGAFVSAIQNALGTHSKGAMGFLTRTGSTIGVFAAVGAAFALTDRFVANYRRVDDALNGVAGGCAAGFLAGIRSRSLPLAITSCAIFGAAIGTYDYAGTLTSSESFESRKAAFFKKPKSPPTMSDP